MQSVRITLGYDGTDFFGSQTQSNVRTVQSELQRAIDRVAPGSGRCVLAGRTDKGVHARGQVASVEVRWERSARSLRTALGAVSPSDLVIRDVQWATAGFHARYDASQRQYRYRIVVSNQPQVQMARYAWCRRSPIDDDLAIASVRRFVGRHSFGAFAGHGWSQSRSRAELVRTVQACEWRRSDAWNDDDHCVTTDFWVTADGFLPQMVRNMVSAVVTVGSGRRPIGWIDELIASGDRGSLGLAAPAHGLTLWRVTYDRQNDATGGTQSHGEYEED
jgi:tRNA pseudouridine38-40 synthase